MIAVYSHGADLAFAIHPRAGPTSRASGANLTFDTRPDQRLSGRNRPEATTQDGCVAEMSG